MDIALFVAGFLESYRYEKPSNTEIKIRTEHLTNVMYLSKSYEWSSMLEVHASVLVAIERGHLKWWYDFSHLERRTVKISVNESGTAVGKFSTENINKVLFCKFYNLSLKSSLNWSLNHSNKSSLMLSLKLVKSETSLILSLKISMQLSLRSGLK